MRRVALIDRSGRVQTFNLAHEQFCLKVGECFCRSVKVVMTDHVRRSGERKPRSERRRFCASVTLLPHGKSAPLPDAVLEVDEVKAALNEQPRRVSWVEVPADAPT